MKKLCMIALVIVVLTLAACGNRNKDNTEPTVNSTDTMPADTDPTLIDPTIMDPLPETNIPDPHVDTSMPEMDTTEPTR